MVSFSYKVRNGQPPTREREDKDMTRYLTKRYELVIVQDNFFEYWDTRYNEIMKTEIENDPNKKIEELKKEGWGE